METLVELDKIQTEQLPQRAVDFFYTQVVTHPLRNKMSLSLLSPAIVFSIHYNNMICLGYSVAPLRPEPMEWWSALLGSYVLFNIKTSAANIWCLQ
jgi:hypothetical protein